MTPDGFNGVLLQCEVHPNITIPVNMLVQAEQSRIKADAEKDRVCNLHEGNTSRWKIEGKKIISILIRDYMGSDHKLSIYCILIRGIPTSFL